MNTSGIPTIRVNKLSLLMLNGKVLLI